jgi:UDP-N-acetylglucosamine--N-acetylmuramyl-(pentapeptide) pyrophosphoryl-undecaprenol N-acetylglucosamine transferase
VPRALARAKANVSVVHQCGAGKDRTVRELYDALGAASRARVVPFIEDMPRALAEADLVIGRAGASAVAEICAVGRPSVLVPYPFAGDHQRYNAESLARAGAAVCVLAGDATVERLVAELERLALDPTTLPRMADAARGLGRPDAAEVIARDLVALAGVGAGAAGSASGSGSDHPGGRKDAAGARGAAKGRAL